MQLLHDLGIDFRVLIINLGAFVVVLILLTRFFFRPFGRFLSDRARHLQDQMSEAERARAQAKQELAEMDARHQQVQEDLAREADRQRQAAREEAQKIMDEANRLARERKRHAEDELHRDVTVARQELRAHTADLATDIARRALARALGPDERQTSVEAAVRHIEQLAQQESN